MRMNLNNRKKTWMELRGTVAEAWRRRRKSKRKYCWQLLRRVIGQFRSLQLPQRRWGDTIWGEFASELSSSRILCLQFRCLCNDWKRFFTSDLNYEQKLPTCFTFTSPSFSLSFICLVTRFSSSREILLVIFANVSMKSKTYEKGIA